MFTNNDQNSNEKTEMFLTTIIIIVIGGIWFIPVFIQLLEVLMVVAVIGGVGFVGYKLYRYDQRTGNLTEFFERKFELPSSREDKQYLNLQPPEELLEDKIKLLSTQLRSLSEENLEMKMNQENQIKEALQVYASDIRKQVNRETIDNIFGEDIGHSQNSGYNRSEEFEKQQFEERLKNRNKELDLREIRQEFSEGLFEQKKDLIEHKVETREQFLSVRQDMTAGFMQIQENLKLLAQGVMNLEVYVKEKFATLEISFMRELDGLKNLLGQMHTEFKQETSEMKLRFGQEFLRIDKQQLTIVDKMRDYESSVRAFGQEMVRIKMDAEKFSMRGEEMLAKAEIAHQQHKAHIQLLSKDVSTSLERMSLREMSFANTVGSAKNKMDEISNQQYLALKDMAHERIGINALREDYQNRVTLEQEKFNRLNDQQRFILQQIQTAKAHGKETAGLQHRLTMTQENLNHSQNQLGMYRQEMAQVRRLSN